MPTRSPLSLGEDASLTEVGMGVFHDIIPDADAARLLGLGLVYNMLGIVRITTAGRARLRLGT